MRRFDLLANAVFHSQMCCLTHSFRDQARSHILEFISKLTMQGFSGRFYGLFFRLAINKPYMHLKNKHMKK